MKRFWKWVVGQKNTIQKWQSTVLHPDRNEKRDRRRLKPTGGSDNELERNEKRNSKILQEDSDNYNMSISLRDLNTSYENEPIDFEEFFEESLLAIESAL
ncbi:unnamed protein product, partial [Onchocerca flexuosa]|uniref:Uncharacterized protein n=1 Tax=Onchocerca flexuosa TaxID=387005 RepID=A0A183HIL7_9BILA